MWNFLAFLVVGFLAGILARGIYPGRQRMGMLATMALGMAGSLVGGLIAWVLWRPENGQFHLAGLLMSIVGALIVLGVYMVATRPSGKGAV